jgi:aspartyl-tRNA(Asn)/glutamyl-tRNA(Gln) amidotransferase subunit A
MTALELAARIRSRTTSAEEVVRASLEAARASHDLNIFLSISQTAILEAQAIDARIAKGETVGPFAGVPLAIKDNLCVQGSRTTAGSRALEHFVSPYTATGVQRLLDAGAINVGKVNLDEFGMGSSTENSAFGVTKNPWDPTRVPGGSSGGSGAVVAAGITPIAVGTDTGGSVRLPAAFTGTLGLKPTYGRVSRYGLVALASSLDQIGGFARSSADLATMLDAICGHDPLDSTSLKTPQDGTNSFVAALGQDIRGMRIGLVREALGDGNSKGVLGGLEAAKHELEKMGAIISEVSLPSLEYGLAAYYLVMCSEASSNLARYDGMVYSNRFDFEGEINEVMSRARGQAFGPETQRRILMGTYALSSGYFDAFYSKALKARAGIAQEFAKVFETTDLLMLPTAPTPAFKIGEKSADPMSMYLTDVDTVTVNLAGLPAISIPFGYEDQAGHYSQTPGLPIGVQFIAPTLQDERLLTVSQALERATSAHFLRTAPQIPTLVTSP